MENLNPLLSDPVTIHLALVTAAFVLAGLVKGVVGLGLPTVAVGLLSVIMTPIQAASLLIVPSLVTNVWQLAVGPGFRTLLSRLWPMLLGICLGTLVGGALLPRDSTGYAHAALGLALVLYSAIGLSAVRMNVSPRFEAWLSPLVGVVTGAITAATGVFVIPAVPYLQGLRLEKDQLVQAMGLAFTVSTIALAATLAQGGWLNPAVAGMSLYALAPALIGMLFGQWIRTRIAPPLFRKCFFAGLLALGLHQAMQSWFQ